MNQTRIINPGPGAAPNAPRPGSGAGNVPFAPGVMSGNLGQSANPVPLARQSGPPAPPQTGSAPSPAPPGQPGMPGMPPMPAPMMQPQNPWPIIWSQLLDAYLTALMESTKKPMIGGMY